MSRKYEVLCVCGFGIGSSLLLKMNAETVLKNAGYDVQVDPMDVTSANGRTPDLVLTSAEIATQLPEFSCPVVIIENFMDLEEIHQKACNEIEKIK